WNGAAAAGTRRPGFREAFRRRCGRLPRGPGHGAAGGVGPVCGSRARVRFLAPAVLAHGCPPGANAMKPFHLVLPLCLAALPATSVAADFCVTNGGQLRTILNLAVGNGQS